jgi:2',3'-cyclic-nucleotide 2'-phosphodiesterase (5'-nucleotidase family)
MANDADSNLWLRIIHINDVYELENYPNFKTLVEKESKSAHKTIVVMGGDFLGPSLLSSLDKGRGMVDIMNECGITHCCFGNHETDIPMSELPNRILQSEFCWVNTNMRELDDVLDIETDAHDVVEITNGTHTKRVGLIGLLTEDPSLYRPDSFKGAKIEPVLTCTEAYLKNVLEPIGLDLIVPITHQRMPEDRGFCNKFGGDVFPLVLGGHDHGM